MPYSREQFVDDTVVYSEDTIAALETFKALRTGNRGNRAQRLPAMQELVDKLTELDGLGNLTPPIKIHVAHDVPEVEPRMENGVLVFTMTLFGNLSIISLLNGYGKIKQFVSNHPDDFVERQRWTINLFRKVFPAQFESLEFHPQWGGFSKPGGTPGYRAAVQMEIIPPAVDTEYVSEVTDVLPNLEQGNRRTPGGEALQHPVDIGGMNSYVGDSQAEQEARRRDTRPPAGTSRRFTPEVPPASGEEEEWDPENSSER